MRIAAAKYAVGAPDSFAAFADRQERLLDGAAARGAQIALLPEYLSLELGAGFGPAVGGELAATLAALQRHRDDWLALYSGIARRTGMLVVAGTFLLDVGGGRYRNRCDLFTPAGGHAWQDKLQLTGFEKGVAVIDGGDALRPPHAHAVQLLFVGKGGRIGDQYRDIMPTRRLAFGQRAHMVLDPT